MSQYAPARLRSARHPCEGIEGCDDGNTADSDSCTSLGQPSFCGDGLFRQDIIDPSAAGFEECDDLNRSEEDTCSNACRIPRCGDGAEQGNELCDDGNVANGDGCNNLCQAEARGCAVDPIGSLSWMLFWWFAVAVLFWRRNK